MLFEGLPATRTHTRWRSLRHRLRKRAGIATSRSQVKLLRLGFLLIV